MIQFSDVDFSYGGQKIFSGLSFTLSPGRFLVISGPARSGKTTLMQIITGMVVPDRGDVILNGEPLSRIVSSAAKLRKLRRTIGGIGGVFSLLRDRTVLENISLMAEISGVPARVARKRALAVCGKYRLSHVATNYPDMISEVERRAVQLARAEAACKSLILADTPVDGLDAKVATFINERLSALHLAGASVLYLTSGSGPESGPDEYLRLQDGKVTA